MTKQETQLAIPQQEQAKAAKAPIALSKRGIQLTSFDELARFCMAVHKSKLAPKGFDSPEAVMVAVQHGLEIGLGPMQALQSIAVINGKPSIYGDAALGVCKAHSEFSDIFEDFNAKTNTARCEVRRKNKAPVIREFSEADARKAQLWGKAGPWQQYTQRMLQMRARSFALRDAFPDALKGIRVIEEQQDITEKPVQARVVEAPTLKLADGTVIGEEPNDFPAVPVPVEPTAAVEIAHGTTASGEARESTKHVGAPESDHDSRGGGKHSQEERDTEGNFNF